jgi:hypothetical protein
MKTRVDAQLVAEARAFRLAFRCEACAHFSEESASCAHGYPNAAHRDADLERAVSVEFCKEFELA